MARFFQPKKKTQLNTKHQSMTVDKLDHQGAGICYQNGKPVFIDGALAGEQSHFARFMSSVAAVICSILVWSLSWNISNKLCQN